jgi:hypothetical protein
MEKRMKRTDFNYKFQVPKTPREVFNKICQVSKWWTTDVEGVSQKLNDQFTVHFGESFVKMEVTQIVWEKKVSWLVKNCSWSFLEHKTEWIGTTIIWSITSIGNSTQVRMTHVGLVPESKCFEICKEGWGLYAGNSLLRFINEGRGIPFDGHGNQNNKGCKNSL